MKRTKLCDRTLPRYSQAEELFNAISHGIGALLGAAVCLLCACKTGGNGLSYIGCLVYGISMIGLYAVSTLYHSLCPGNAKKVFQIIDHCTIYILIAGTYTPILLTAFIQTEPAVGWGLLALQWGVSILAIILNAIDLKRFRIFSYSAYVILGWAILFVWPVAARVISPMGLWYLLLGGISYTVGAILYGIGSKHPWFHSVFHLFVVIGSMLQFIAIYQYIL